MSRVHLGLDVGGTASRWVACDASGAVVARGSVSGATAHVFNPAERARLADMLGQVGAAISGHGLAATSLTAGLTGFGPAASAEIEALAESALQIDAGTVLVMDDIVQAYAAHFEPGQGHLISAGTGSIGIHVRADGQIIRVGGRGILIDDAGSGSWIALRALDGLYRVLDRTGSFDDVAVLAEQMFALVGGREWTDMRQFVYAGDRGRVGALAVGVGKAAELGDELALGILKDAGTELAQLALALVARAGTGEVALIGGVLKLHPVIAAECARALAGHSLEMPSIDSALAAARLQTGAGNVAWRDLIAGGRLRY